MPLPVDLSTPTEPWIHDEHHVGRKRVSLDALVATQERYNPAKVKAMKPGRSGRPTVVLTDQGVLIHDGHHRVLKARQEGQRSLWVDAYDGRAR